MAKCYFATSKQVKMLITRLGEGYITGDPSQHEHNKGRSAHEKSDLYRLALKSRFRCGSSDSKATTCFNICCIETSYKQSNSEAAISKKGLPWHRIRVFRGGLQSLKYLGQGRIQYFQNRDELHIIQTYEASPKAAKMDTDGKNQ